MKKRALNVPCVSAHGRHRWKRRPGQECACIHCGLLYTGWTRRTAEITQQRTLDAIRKAAFMAGAVWRGNQDGKVVYGDRENAARWYVRNVREKEKEGDDE